MRHEGSCLTWVPAYRNGDEAFRETASLDGAAYWKCEPGQAWTYVGSIPTAIT